jgi:hypothetical protein
MSDINSGPVPVHLSLYVTDDEVLALFDAMSQMRRTYEDHMQRAHAMYDFGEEIRARLTSLERISTKIHSWARRTYPRDLEVART